MPDKKIIWQFASRFQSLLVLILMIVAMSLLSDKFLTAANGWNWTASRLLSSAAPLYRVAAEQFWAPSSVV